MKEIKLSNISKLTKDELKLAIENCFKYAPEARLEDRLSILMEAQFYTRELERREDTSIAKRDLLLEIVVIVLIAMELALGLYQEKDQSRSATAQQEVLLNLQRSTAATAQTLVSVQSTMQSMNDRLGTQVNRSAQIAMDFAFNVPQKKADLFNRGNVDLTIWGYKVDGERARFYKRPISIKRSERKDLATLLSDIRNANGNGLGNLDIYLRDDFGNEFTGETRAPASNLTAMTTTLEIVQRRWSYKDSSK